MLLEITSKNIDGITDLVVVAPIKEGFIEAYENITYATRLKLVAEALNRVRVAAREHERITPFSDVTERILTLLDFRVGIIDKDLFSLRVDEDDKKKDANEPRAMALESRRYLYLTATFDGAWEPYMRLIWDPLGPFLDLLFCNCDGYVTATDHSFAEYAQWVRDNQMDSAIFYATTGLTIRDHHYLSKLERAQRDGNDGLTLAETVMDYPEDKATATRRAHLPKTIELGLEALTVLYKLADYYPPQWLTGSDGGLAKLNEGQRLAQVARDLLRGWDGLTAWLDGKVPNLPQPSPEQQARWQGARKVYAEPLFWYETGRAELDRLESKRVAARRKDPEFVRSEVQGGIIEKQGTDKAPVRQGALLLFSIHNAAAARQCLTTIPVHFEQAEASSIYHNIGFTPEGLRRLGVDREVIERFPKEFREGMAARSGLFGDMRENHPRNWILPGRNGPAFMGAIAESTRLPPVEISEVDIVIQIRTTDADADKFQDGVKNIAKLAEAGATLQAVEWLESSYDLETGLTRDHFGFVDGMSQPKPALPGAAGSADRDKIALGEILVGYGNNHGDAAPGEFEHADSDETAWRKKYRTKARDLQMNGTYLVLRKIEQDIDTFGQWAETAAAKINGDHPDLTPAMTADRLKSLVLGRNTDGTSLIPPGTGGANDFDFSSDANGHSCPFASHIRRANPRKTNAHTNAPMVSRQEFGRPTPRILRRGMSFNQTDGAGKTQRGVMFMAYNASISEQYETIQRWLNGGNSTDIASAHNDPLTGVQPKDGAGVFRFVAQTASGPVPVRIDLPAVHPAPTLTGKSEPGRHPFAPLHWGLYLFVPSRTALATLAREEGEYTILEAPLELAVGQRILDRLKEVGVDEAAKEWKRLLEDFDAKDPSQRDLSPNMWSAIRWQLGGAKNLRRLGFVSGRLKNFGNELENPLLEELAALHPDYDWENGPPRDKNGIIEQNVILVAGRSQVRQVLADWKNFSTEEQLRRIELNSGPIFVTQQPDNNYRNTTLDAANLDYPEESTATNDILMGYDEKAGFDAGYAAGVAVLNMAKGIATASGRSSFKFELRRQYLLPALGGLCQRWYGLPDNKHMLAKGWTWERIGAAVVDAEGHTLTRTKAHCPGDFLSPSRNAFYPRPSLAVGAFAHEHGSAILKSATDFVTDHRSNGTKPAGTVADAMFGAIQHPAVLARNLIGTMVGAIPPMDGNLRGILLEWLGEKSLWRYQAALRTAMAGAPADSDFTKARTVLYRPIAQAMCKRPAPDLLYRTAKGEATIRLDPAAKGEPSDVTTQEGDLLVVSLVSAAQRSLLKLQSGDTGEGDVSIVFGGKRTAAAQGYKTDGNGDVIPDPHADDDHPVHACPAQDMAMGAIMGIMAALLDAGTIQALPASLIVRISDWK
jgi:Dyp-type peroxidase family